MENFNNSNAVQEIVRAVADLLSKEDKSDRTFKAKIEEKSNSKKYKVLYRGNTYTVKSSASYNIGDYVWVCAPCNNWEDLFIVCKS